MQDIDLSILYFFNQTLASPAMDAVMAALTSVKWWMPVYILSGIYLIWKYKWRGVIVLLSAVLVVAFTDQLAQLVLKPLADRLRPCADVAGQTVVEWIRLPIGMRHGPSFPSSHALNNAAVALFFGLVFRNKTVLCVLLALATLVGISRMYLGLHYPTDILGGLILGSIIGSAFALLYQRMLPEAKRIS
jgi:membrane-associated phospholipid phosphatase